MRKKSQRSPEFNPYPICKTITDLVFACEQISIIAHEGTRFWLRSWPACVKNALVPLPDLVEDAASALLKVEPALIRKRAIANLGPATISGHSASTYCGAILAACVTFASHIWIAAGEGDDGKVRTRLTKEDYGNDYQEIYSVALRHPRIDAALWIAHLELELSLLGTLSMPMPRGPKPKPETVKQKRSRIMETVVNEYIAQHNKTPSGTQAEKLYNMLVPPKERLSVSALRPYWRKSIAERAGNSSEGDEE